jgi:hypothetical protein
VRLTIQLSLYPSGVSVIIMSLFIRILTGPAREQLRVVRAQRPADIGTLAAAPRSSPTLFPSGFAPKPGNPIIDDNGGQQICRGHLDCVFAFEGLRNQFELDRQLAVRGQRCVQLCQAVVKLVDLRTAPIMPDRASAFRESALTAPVRRIWFSLITPSPSRTSCSPPRCLPPPLRRPSPAGGWPAWRKWPVPSSSRRPNRRASHHLLPAMRPRSGRTRCKVEDADRVLSVTRRHRGMCDCRRFLHV